jgi:ABC-type multidrug transport system permease subunit
MVAMDVSCVPIHVLDRGKYFRSAHVLDADCLFPSFFLRAFWVKVHTPLIVFASWTLPDYLHPALGKHDVTCAAVELLKVDPPSGQTCGAYFAQYISFAGGYLTNSDATSGCEFCSTATTDQVWRLPFSCA